VANRRQIRSGVKKYPGLLEGGRKGSGVGGGGNFRRGREIVTKKKNRNKTQKKKNIHKKKPPPSISETVIKKIVKRSVFGVSYFGYYSSNSGTEWDL